MMNRVNDKVKPPLIQVAIMYNHNPDFLLWHWFIEVKGFIRNAMWLPGLEALPSNIKDRYKVVLVTQNKKERAKYKRKLDNLGIEWNDDVVPKQWIVRALQEWEKIPTQEKEKWDSTIKRYITLEQ